MIRDAVLAAALAAAPLSATAQTPAPAPAATPMPYGAPIDLARAKVIAAAAEAEAGRNGWWMAVTIVEPTGEVVLTHKMDQTQYGSLDVALGKAKTSARFRRSTADFAAAVKAGTLNAIFSGALAIEGGEIIVDNGRVIGAIGISGGSPAQDGQVARAALQSR